MDEFWEPLAPGEVLLGTLPMPISFDVASEVMRAMSKTAKNLGLEGVLLTDGSCRMVGRPISTDEPGTTDQDQTEED